MSTSPFEEAIRAAAPDLNISNYPPSQKVPSGYTEITFRGKPTSSGYRLEFRMGKERPRDITFSSEEEAGTFIGNLFALADDE